MGFEIDKFIAKVEEFANKDVKRQGKSDGKLDDYEKASLFNNKDLTQELKKAVENGELSEIDANEIFGFSKSDGKSDKASPSKTSVKMMQDDVSDRISKGGTSYFLTNDKNNNLVVADEVDWDTMLSDLKTRLISSGAPSVDSAYYTKLFDQVSSVAEIVKNTLNKTKQGRTDGKAYDSRKDVQKLFDSLKKELKADNNDEFAKFRTEILKNFTDIIEKHQIAKEEAQVTNAYNEFRKSGLSREAAVKAVKDVKNSDGSKKFKGSYFESFVDKNSVTNKGLLKSMEEGIVLEDARREVMDAVWAQRGTKLTKSSDVEAAAKKLLGDKNDKYTAKIFRGELSLSEKVKWERSAIKDFRKAVAAYNRVEANKQKEYNEKEITDVVKDDKVFAQLVRDGQLIKQNKNGSYNISELADLIRDAVSFADYRANYQTKDNSAIGEIEGVQYAISMKTNGEVQISRADAKRMIDFCGFDRDKKNILLTLYNGSIGGLASGLASLTTAFTVTKTLGGVTLDASNLNSKLKNMEFPITITSQNDINFNLDVSVKTIVDGVQVDSETKINTFEIMRKLAQQGFGAGEAGFEILEDGTFRLWINKSSQASVTQMAQLKTILGDDFEIDVREIDVEREPDKVNTSKAFFYGMMVGMALSILSEALKELPGEKSILATNPKANTPKEYENELALQTQLPPQARSGIQQIAEYYYQKDGNLDGYKKFLEAAAGGSSVLNKKELIFAVYMKLQEIKSGIQLPETKPQQKPEPVVQEVKQEPVVQQEQMVQPQPVEYETKFEEIPAFNYTPNSVDFRAWEDLVNGYSCLNSAKYKVAVKGSKGNKVMLNNRMVKVLQAIDLSKVGKDKTIQQVYDLEKIAEFTRKAIETDIDTAMKEFPDFPIDKQKYMDVVKADAGVKGKVLIPELYENGTKYEWNAGNKVRIKRGGTDVTTVSTTTRTINGETHYYKRVKNSDSEWVEIKKEEYDKLQK